MAADEVAETSGPEGLIKVAKGMVDDLVDEVGALRQDMLRVAHERGCVIIGGRIRRNPKLPPSLSGGRQKRREVASAPVPP
jgi:hypothetical protein